MRAFLLFLLILPMTSQVRAASSDVIKAELTFFRKGGTGSAIHFKIIESNKIMKMTMKDEKKAEQVKELKSSDANLFLAGLNDLAWRLAYKEAQHRGPCVKASEVSVGSTKASVCLDEKRKRALVEGKVKEMMGFLE